MVQSTTEFGSQYFNDESNRYQQPPDTLTDTEDTTHHHQHHRLPDIYTTPYMAHVGESYWSQYNAVEYIPGNCNIIINVPHGGHKCIDQVRIRTKHDGCIVQDVWNDHMINHIL